MPCNCKNLFFFINLPILYERTILKLHISPSFTRVRECSSGPGVVAISSGLLVSATGSCFIGYTQRHAGQLRAETRCLFLSRSFFFIYFKSAVNPSWSICGVIGCAAVHHHRPHPTTTTSTNTAARPVCEPHSLLLICSCSPVSGVVFVFLWWASAFIVLFKQLAAAFLWLSFNRKEHSSSYVLRRSVPLVFYYGRRPGSRQGLRKTQTRDNMFDMRGIPFVLLDIVCLVLGMYLNAFFPSLLLCTMLLLFLM